VACVLPQPHPLRRLAGQPAAGRHDGAGVPAAYFEGGNRLEIQTGNSTVVIFANRPATVAHALRGVNSNFPPGVDLPAPGLGPRRAT
jgi:hypothetical protein